MNSKPNQSCKRRDISGEYPGLARPVFSLLDQATFYQLFLPEAEGGNVLNTFPCRKVFLGATELMQVREKRWKFMIFACVVCTLMDWPEKQRREKISAAGSIPDAKERKGLLLLQVLLASSLLILSWTGI